jgi:hypothetical protein
MATPEDRNRPTGGDEDAELLEDIDPEAAEAEEVHGGELAAGPERRM